MLIVLSQGRVELQQYLRYGSCVDFATLYFEWNHRNGVCSVDLLIISENSWNNEGRSKGWN